MSGCASSTSSTKASGTASGSRGRARHGCALAPARPSSAIAWTGGSVRASSSASRSPTVDRSASTSTRTPWPAEIMLESIQASALSIPFKASFRHASAERAATQSVWVSAHARSGATGYGEGCPREYVTNEALASALAFVGEHATDWRHAIREVGSLHEWIRLHRREIDANPAAWTAVELALLDLFGKLEGKTVEALL